MMASADQLEREAERRRLAFLAAARAAGFNLAPVGTPVDVPQMTEAAGPIPKKPDAGFWDNVKGIGSQFLAFVPGTQQSEDMAAALQDDPTILLKGPVQSASNVVDLLPYIDTGEKGVNYANAYNRGEGLGMILNDALTLYALGKAGTAGARAVGKSVALPDPQELIAANDAARRAALYEFINNPNRAAAIESLPLPTGVEPPYIVIPSDKMMNILDEGYKNMWEGGQKYVDEARYAVDEEYPDWRQSVEEELFGGKQPISSFGGKVDIEKRAPYGGYSYDSPKWGPSRFSGSFWEVKPRINKPMTITPGDSFSVGIEDVFPYQKQRVLPESELFDPQLAYNEVQIYGGRIPPEDLMNFKLTIIEPSAMGGIDDAQRLAMVNQNLEVAKRLAGDKQSLSMDVHEYSKTFDEFGSPSSGFGQIKQTLVGQDVVDYLNNQKLIIQERLKRGER